MSAKYRPHLFEGEELDFQLLRAMTYALYGGAAPGECLWAAGEAGRTGRKWVEAWTELGERLERRAVRALAAHHPRTARDGYLRAYNAFRAAEYYAPRREGRQRELWRRSCDCFEAAGALFTPAFEAVGIPYEDDELPGYFLRAAGPVGPRPTVLFVGGGDASGEELYFAGAPAALARGFHVLLFHGPGQRGAMHTRDDWVFRPDYEVPLRAAVDFLVSRPEVDPQAIVLVGLGQGGYFALRAAAVDPRIRACIANPGMSDLYGALLQGLPELGRKLVEGAPGWLLDGASLLRAPVHTSGTLLDYVLWTYGVESPSAYWEKVRAYRAPAGLAETIRCAVLLLGTEGDGEVVRAQARQLYQELRGPRKLHLFEPSDGASAPCAFDNLPLVNEVMWGWLEEELAL